MDTLSAYEQQQQAQQKQRNIENSITKGAKEVSLEQLSDEQRERLFLIYAKQQQQAELAILNQADRVEFERLVSPKEQEYLIKLRAREVKVQYEKQLSNKSSNNSKLQTFKSASSTLTQEYVNFKKCENNNVTKGAENNFVPTKLPNSPQGFESWYFTGKASDEFQISYGVIPPQNITPSGALWYSQTLANLKTAEAKKLIEAEKNRLKEAGFSPQQIQEKENDIYTKAFDQVHEQWKQERAEALKAWQESKGIESFQKFETQRESQQPQNRQVVVNIADLENWRKEAQKIGRSEYHLKKIDLVINSVKQKNDPVSSVKIDERDFKVMQRDRHEFHLLPTEEQTHTSSRRLGVR